MTTPPTYEELLAKVSELETEIARSRLIEEALKKSEEFSSSLLENSPDAIIVYNPDTSVKYVNPSFEEISGYSSEEALGTKVPYPWWIDDPMYGTIKHREKQGLDGIYRSERRYRKKNGDTFYVEINVTPIFHEGKLSYSFSTWTDIKERKKSEHELKKSSLIIDSTSDAIITTDIKGNIILWNSGAEHIYGYSKEEVEGKPISILYKGNNLNILRNIISELFKGNDISSMELTSRGKKGNDIHILLSLTTIKDEYGNIIELVGLTKDITKRKKMENALKKNRDKLEERVRERTTELNQSNKELYEKTLGLEEVNTALTVLLERRGRDREENEEKIVMNVKEFLLPYVIKLKKGPLTENQKNYVELLEAGLHNIISPFAHKLTSRHMHITPAEMQVVNLVKEGKTSKEIAEILNSTERAVIAHRLNFRKKLKLDRKTNLRTYLLSFK